MKSLLNHLDKDIDMTTMEIFMTCMAFIFCTVVLPLICLLMMLVVWWRMKTGKGIDIDSSEWEEE